MRFVQVGELDMDYCNLFHFCFLGTIVLARHIFCCRCSQVFALGLAFYADFPGFGVGKIGFGVGQILTSEKCCSWGVG